MIFRRTSPWIADLSETAGAKGQKSVDISLPVGERATVGVYGTKSIGVEAPFSISPEVLVQYMERGHADQRVMVPYWLAPARWRPPPVGVLRDEKDFPPGGERHYDQKGNPYAVRLWARAQGAFPIRIICDRGKVLAVNLHVTPAVPAPDFAVGYYTAPGLWTYQNWRVKFEQLRDLRCNTFTVYSGEAGREIPADETNTAARNIAWQLDLAVEVGLIDGTQPVIVYARSPVDLDEAPQYGRHVDRWPELIGYGKDEASANASGEAEARGMVQMFHSGEHPYRSGAAMHDIAILKFGDGIDIWICHVDNMSDLLKREARRQGKALWAYCARVRGTNAPLNRYLSGWWAYANRPEGLLSWTHLDYMLRWDLTVPSAVHPDGTWTPMGYYEYCLDAPDGPLSSVGAEGRRDGVVDYMVLRDLERALLSTKLDSDEDPARVALVEEALLWLQDNVDRVDVNFWPDDKKPFGDCKPGNPCHWDTVDMVLPPIRDFNALRRTALGYARRLRG